MLVPAALANQLETDLNNITDPTSAMNTLWTSVCNYVSANGQVLYSWTAFMPPILNTPDPMVTFMAKIQTGGTLTPNGQTTCAGALSMLSAAMNANISTWTIIPPAGFAIVGFPIVSTALQIKQSGATDRKAALLSLATDIIMGITSAIAPVMMGVHGQFVVGGTATPIKIF